MSNKKIKIKVVASVSSIIGRLEDLIESLKKDYITMISHDKALILQPQDPIRLDMEAQTKPQKPGSRQQLSVKLKWQRKPETWQTMINTPTQKPAGPSTEATCRMADPEPPRPEKPAPATVLDPDMSFGLAPNEVQAQEKPLKKIQRRKSAMPQRRKSRV
jgi:amphi-Trp domain-containing protein